MALLGFISSSPLLSLLSPDLYLPTYSTDHTHNQHNTNPNNPKPQNPNTLEKEIEDISS
jgi:hypothetical protein